MRLFIAIELNDDIREYLAFIQSHLKYAGADAKWVTKDSIHLTLKFLGEVTESDNADVDKIKMALDTVAGSVKPFELNLGDIGVFPNLNLPRVIWVGLDKGADESRSISKKIDEAMSKLGFRKESRGFAAHLTIGRVRSSKNWQALRDKISKFSSKLPRQICSANLIGGAPPTHLKFISSGKSSKVITSVALFQSTLTPQGPIYTKLYESKFQG